ncbi:MAG: glycosyltransferase [Patescibacteria group bacterium]
MNNNDLKIGACIMVHNMAPFIGACVQSLQWTNGIFVYDDHSTDGSIDVAQAQSEIPINVEYSKNKDVAFKRGELETRNYVIDRAFKALGVDILVIADADELFSSLLRSKIIESFSDPDTDSMAFSIWHLYDEKQYIHFWETKINGVDMIDPHTRIIKKDKHFIPLFEDGSHPILELTKHTACFHGPYHFHLKYHYKSTLPNYSIYFLPERPRKKDVLPYLRPLPFELPIDIKSAISLVDWGNLPSYKETPHHSLKRIKFTDPREALIHPKDKINI